MLRGIFSSFRKTSEPLPILEVTPPEPTDTPNTRTVMQRQQACAELQIALNTTLSIQVSTLLKLYASSLSAETTTEESHYCLEAKVNYPSSCQKLEEEYLDAVKKSEECISCLPRSYIDNFEDKQSPSADINLLADHENEFNAKANIIKLEKQKIDRRLWELQQSRNAYFYCPGELEAITKMKVKRWTSFLTNTFDMDPMELHFRIAHSQASRKCNYSYANLRVSEVEYIVNPTLKAKWLKCRTDLAQKYGFLEESMKPVILFHGTNEESMEKIINNNFDAGKISANTGNYGAYGRGFYFSEYPAYSLGYCRGFNYMLVCLVIVGKAYSGPNASLGKPLEPGFDAHVSPDGCSEVIIFNPDQILPCYRIKYAPNPNAYTYTNQYTTQGEYY